MNVANLQLEGLLMAVASLNRLLVDKGLVSSADIDEALRQAEASIAGDGRLAAEVPPANRDAVFFPVRFLQLANTAPAALGFSQIARSVGQMKPT
jgi:hypothetical protein